MGCKFIHHPIRSMSNKIAILQLCVDTKCLVLQLLHMDYIPQSIRDFLCDPHTTFVGLTYIFLAKRLFPVSYKGRPSLKALAYGVVGLSMRKCSKICNYKGDWESIVIDKELVEQACTDVYASYSIAHKLLEDDV
ncbi:hypothetical protein Pfo_017404 [Paulownia fortunei]|nr:hypothetical protein Pfo_017404 [Paulownia fortunei]